jgi:hypothetical protein
VSMMSLKHKDISTRPWSNWTKADYTPEQWHNACLIHIHDGPPTSKSQCKLPVKTPTGTLNRNGVHAAAAALAGARGGVNAPSDEKAKAARALVRYYRELGDQAPASLLKHALNDEFDFLAHYGVKGMHWGIRRDVDGERTPMSAKTKSTIKKVAIGAGLVAVTAAGAVVAAKVIATHGASSLSAVRDNSAALGLARDRVAQMMNSSRAVDAHLAKSHPDAVLKMAQQRVANLNR